MHIITGGAFNGKWDFVKEFYNLVDEAEFIKFSGYNNDDLPNDFLDIKSNYLIIQGLECYVKGFLGKTASIPSQTEAFILNCLNWQAANPSSELILIGNDISKGVVPTDASLREWRDMTGLMYQRLVQVSTRYDVIWHGINQQLK